MAVHFLRHFHRSSISNVNFFVLTKRDKMLIADFAIKSWSPWTLKTVQRILHTALFGLIFHQVERHYGHWMTTDAKIVSRDWSLGHDGSLTVTYTVHHQVDSQHQCRPHTQRANSLQEFSSLLQSSGCCLRFVCQYDPRTNE